MAYIEYDNPRSSITSLTVITHADVYDGLDTYNSVADVFVNQTVQAFFATWSYSITRDIAISIESFGNYRQELSTALLGLFGGRSVPETRDILRKFGRLQQRVLEAQRKFFSWQERLSRASRTPSLANVFGEAGAGALLGGAYGANARARAQRAAPANIAQLLARLLGGPKVAAEGRYGQVITS